MQLEWLGLLLPFHANGKPILLILWTSYSNNASGTKGGANPPFPASSHVPQLTDHVTQLDKLITSQLGLLAQRRLARGVKLNHAEATVCLIDPPRPQRHG